MDVRYYSDVLFPNAVEIVLDSKVVSAGRLQSKLQIGPSRATKLLSELELLGIIGASHGNSACEILITAEEWQNIKHCFVYSEPLKNAPSDLVYCRHCGKAISRDSKFCDGCGKSTYNSKKEKKKHPFIAFIVVFVALFIIIGSFGRSDPEEPVKVNSSTTSEQKISDQKSYGIGDRLELDGVYATLNDVYEVEGNILLEPNDGNVFVLCEFLIENNTDEDLIVSSVLNFSAYFDDFAVEYSFGALSSKESNMQLDSTIAPGKKLKGVVGYEVPEGWSEIEISYQPDLFESSTFVFTYSR